ncbi:adenosylmethionine--8-amino-7-oxononanoate transaminase [Verrucomicrobiota bacterium]
MSKNHVWHPYTKFSATEKQPLPMITGGDGIYLIDDQGNRFIDAIASWWCITLGHNHPRIVKAIQEQAGKLQHSILGNLNHPWADELARRLAESMPTPDRHVMFASDGSCAVDASLKMAAQYFYNTGIPGKTKFLTLEHDYHGDTIGAVSVGYVPDFHKPFGGIIPKEFMAPLPDYESGDGFAATQKIIDEHADEIAAVILEPLCQGSAGMRMYSPQYLKDIAALCKERNILLIIDEIAMGFGRTGEYWTFNHAGIDPDIVCVGKGITSGYLPISAAVCKDEIYKTFTDAGPEDHTFYHGHTFCGNPIAAATALEVMDIYDEMDIAGRARRLGAQMEQAFKRMVDHPAVKELRHLGLIGVVELNPCERTKERAVAIRDDLRDQGILIRPLSNIFYLMPPFIITEQELADLCEAFLSTIERHA